MDDLRLRCKPVQIEVVGGPRQIVVHAIEAHAQQMLSPLCGTPPVPAGRLVGADVGWQPWNGYKGAVLVNGTCLSAHRGTCHGRVCGGLQSMRQATTRAREGPVSQGPPATLAVVPGSAGDIYSSSLNGAMIFAVSSGDSLSAAQMRSACSPVPFRSPAAFGLLSITFWYCAAVSLTLPCSR
jgi:hypothetical protein